MSGWYNGKDAAVIAALHEKEKEGSYLSYRHIVKLAAVSLILIVAGVMFYVPGKAKSENYTGDPTVFIHGYKGTVNSFGHMLNRFEKEYKWGTRDLIYRVDRAGELHVQSSLKGQGRPAFVQVILEDNRASFEDSTAWISAVMKHMRENYSIESVNLVGHSMGGIMSLKYTMEYAGEEFPAVSKLIAIGSPFDGIYDKDYFITHTDPAAYDLRRGSAALQLLSDGKFPAGIPVLSIGSTGDAIALPESVVHLRNIIPAQLLTEIMIDDLELGHSALHENREVDELIHSFLWQEMAQ